MSVLSKSEISWCVGSSPVFSAICIGPDPFVCLERRRCLRKHDGYPSIASKGVGGVFRGSECGGSSGFETGKRWIGRKHLIAVDVDVAPIEIVVHEALIQSRDGAAVVFLGIPEKTMRVTKLWADGGHQSPKLAYKLETLGLGSLIELIN